MAPRRVALFRQVDVATIHERPDKTSSNAVSEECGLHFSGTAGHTLKWPRSLLANCRERRFTEVVRSEVLPISNPSSRLRSLVLKARWFCRVDLRNRTMAPVWRAYIYGRRRRGTRGLVTGSYAFKP
jgi:hypothetical protein